MIWVALVVSVPFAFFWAYAAVCAVRGRSIVSIEWPVSRRAYDDMVRIADTEREHNRKLTRILFRLKTAHGAYLPTKREVRVEQEVDRIEAAIRRSKHAKNPAIRTALSNFAESEMAKGTEIAIIVEQLDNWDRVKDDLVDDDDEDEGLLS